MAKGLRFQVWRLAGSILAAVLLAGLFVGWRANRALHLSQQEVRTEHEICVERRPYVPPANINFEVVSSPQVFSQLARLNDRLYIAGPAGLAEYDLTGTLLREFLVGIDLPSSPLVAMVAGTLEGPADQELVIATAEEGLLLFDGRTFREIYPLDREARSITTILPTSRGRLLLGTKKRGVLLYDGKQITELHPTLSRQYIQALAGTEVDLWVGTLNHGVLHWHAGTTESFSEEQGLPDRQVQAISLAGDKSYVGTPLGVAEFDSGRFARVLGKGLLVTSLDAQTDGLWIGTEDQGVVNVPLAARRAGAILHRTPNLPEVRQFLETEKGTYVLTRSAVYQMNTQGFEFKEVLKPRSAVLSDRNISALAMDKYGQLWVGYFDRGLDLLPNDAGRAQHIENERVFCVNRIWPDAKSGTVAVATANGLVRFGASGSQEQVLTRADGLIADHVTDVIPYREGLAIATPAGLTFLDGAGARSMYAFHGLVNNHVYALAVSGDDLIVGTLGGLSVIGHGDVKANYTAGASGLKQNWITAIVPLGEDWMIGTYGSGIVGLDRAGHFRSFEKATADLEINPNAMLVTARLVLAGTLGQGLYIYDRDKQRWRVLKAGLPSLNVTALAENNGYLYVGTDNGLVRIQEQKLQP